MMRVLASVLALVLVSTAPAAARSVVDSAGRRVEVPDRVTRVFTAGPPASTLLYVLAPQVMVGWARSPSAAEKAYLMPQVRDLPEVGRLTGRGNTVNLENLIATKPDLILDVGTINDTYRSLADRIQDQTGIPYLLIDGSLDKTKDSLTLLGQVLGVEPRARQLSVAADEIFAEVRDLLIRVPQGQRPRVYLARQASGLQTGTRGSINTEIIERAGAINVVQGIAGRPGLVAVSAEQIIGWAPDTIISLEPGFQVGVQADPVWKPVPAVAQHRVFVAPALPFGWIDSPPSINRLIGLQWMLQVFYPQVATGDLKSKVRAFYGLFYQIELPEAALVRLIPEAR